jgi:hypothetical protein
MIAPPVDMSSELKALPRRLRGAVLIALNKAINGSNERFVLQHAQRRNPALFATILPRAIVAGLQVLSQPDSRTEFLARIRARSAKPTDVTLLAALRTSAGEDTTESVAVVWALLSAQDSRLQPDEMSLLARLLRHAFAEPEPLAAALSRTDDESGWLSDADLEELGAMRPVKDT